MVIFNGHGTEHSRHDLSALLAAKHFIVLLDERRTMLVECIENFVEAKFRKGMYQDLGAARGQETHGLYRTAPSN